MRIFYSSLSFFCFKCFFLIINRYNDLIKTTELQLTNVSDEWSWPIPEFITIDGILKKTKKGIILTLLIIIKGNMPPIGWNQPTTLANIRQAFRSISMHKLPSHFQSCVATQVFSMGIISPLL